MRNLLLLLGALVIVAVQSCAVTKRAVPEVSATVMTYNVRLDHAGDQQDNWHQRKADMVAYLLREKPDFLGVQEALAHQVAYLDSTLSEAEYRYIGVGRDDGKEAGEFMAIFYRADRWRLVADSTCWLSETPGVPSRGWDAACHRTLTVGQFEHRDSQRRIALLNTHLDHVGAEARANSVGLLRSQAKAIPEDIPLILMGDFNFTPDHPLYQLLVADFEDTYLLSRNKPQDVLGTFNGFSLERAAERRIDYIFVRPGVLRLRDFRIDTPTTRTGRQLSDHFPVIANILFL